MQLVRFRHRGLRQLHEDGNAKGVPSAMADKLRKLLFALETAETLVQLGRFPGWKLHPQKVVHIRSERLFDAQGHFRR